MVSEVVKANNPLIIAHRGFSAQAPENTIAAFDAAIKSGVPFIELDVTLTKDGELIIIHDDTLDRTTNGKGLVSEFTLEELKKLDAGEWFCREFKGEQLPTLSEVLDRYGNKIAINIEIKSQNDPDTPIVDKVVEMVKNKKLESAVVISSFDHNLLKQVNNLNKIIKIGVLSDENDLDKIDIVELTKSLNGISFNPCSKNIKKSHIDKLHKANIKVFPWFYAEDDTIENLQSLLKLGVDGVFTNHANIIDSYKK